MLVLPMEIRPPASRIRPTIDEWKWAATSAATRSMTSGLRTLTRGRFASLVCSLMDMGDIVRKGARTNPFSDPNERFIPFKPLNLCRHLQN
jgi:hypothetical protein